MKLHPARESDLSFLLPWSRDFESASQELYGGPREPFLAETLREFAARPERGGVYVLKEGRRAIGYTVLVRFWSNEARGETVVIDELYVAPEHRGGSGMAALSAIESFASAAGCTLLALEVAPTQQRAAALYRRAGYAKGHTVYYKALDAG